MLPTTWPRAATAAGRQGSVWQAQRRRATTVRYSHEDYPAVLPAESDPDNLMDFSDPMMTHERYNPHTRITSKAEGKVTYAQRRVLEMRLNRQLEGRIRAEEIRTAISMQKQEAMDKMRNEILVGDEIPTSVTTVTITHIGTLDGFDEPVPEVQLTRRQALAHQDELGMALCLVDISEECDHAICRMRHLNQWLERQARTKIAYRTAQQQQSAELNNAVTEVDVRANIDLVDLIKKAEEVCSYLVRGRRVRLQARNCSRCQDSAELLHYATETIYTTSMAGNARKPVVKFFVGRPMFSKHAASCVIAPMAADSHHPSQLIDKESLMELATAVEEARDEQFERDVRDDGDFAREAMEESRRRNFYGAQENFLSAKMRDEDLMAKHESWAMPITNHELQQLEYNSELRAAGQTQLPNHGIDAEDRTGLHEWMSPEQSLLETVGHPKEEIELSPGPDGAPRFAPEPHVAIVR